MEHTRAFLAYDTLCRIAAEIPEDGEQLLEQCEEEAHGLERTLSMFDPDSELSRLCRDIRPGEAVPVSETLYTFLEQNLEICRLSGGAFDPTVGPVVKLWDFLSQTPRIPSAERIRAVLDRVGYQHVRLDRNTRTVTFDLSGIGLDPGAAGKGFALGLTVDRLRQGGVRQAVLDYGGNLFVIGAHQDAQGGTRPWKVAIRDPDNTGSVFGTVQLQDAGIATSSWYEHSFQKNGTVYHHLLDPRTRIPHAADTEERLHPVLAACLHRPALHCLFHPGGRGGRRSGGPAAQGQRRDDRICGRTGGWDCGRVSGRGVRPCLIDLDAKSDPPQCTH